MEHIIHYKIFESIGDYHDVQDICFELSDNDDYEVAVIRNYNGMTVVIERNDSGLIGLNYMSDIIKRLMEFKPEYEFLIKLDRDGQWTNIKIVGDSDSKEKITPDYRTDDYTGQTYLTSTTETMGSGRLFNLLDRDYTYQKYQKSIYYAARKIYIILINNK